MQHKTDIYATLKYISSKIYVCSKNKNKAILTRNKCGSRFIDGIPEFTIVDYEANNTIFNEFEKIYWIIRPPLDHFLSAIQTEHSNAMRDYSNKKIKIKTEEDKLKFDILNQLITDVSKEPYFRINTQEINNQFGHYSPQYEMIYNKLHTEYVFFNKISFIELSNLSTLIGTKFNVSNNTFNKSSYSFEKYYTKDEILHLLKTNFKKEWSILLPIIENDNNYYEKILNFNQADFLKNKINDLYAELNVCIPLFLNYKEIQFKQDMYTINKIIKNINELS